MTDALTDGQVRDWVRKDGDAHVFGHERFAFLATELLALRLKNERLRAALVLARRWQTGSPQIGTTWSLRGGSPVINSIKPGPLSRMRCNERAPN